MRTTPRSKINQITRKRLVPSLTPQCNKAGISQEIRQLLVSRMEAFRTEKFEKITQYGNRKRKKQGTGVEFCQT